MPENQEALPFVSVIMPIRNEEKWIERSLESILLQKYPQDRMEVIVADGMSDDATRTILRNFSNRDARIRIIDNPGRIMAKGFNTGCAYARGDILLMMGGHTNLSEDYVRVCVQYLQAGEADCVGGLTETMSDTPQADAISLAMASPFGVGGVSFRVGNVDKPTYVDTVAFGAYKRKFLAKIGLLDEELVRDQDDEFNYRLRKSGGRIMLIPGIVAKYYSRTTIQKLWSQYFQYGFWKVRVLQKHPAQMRPRQFAPLLFVGALIASIFLAMFSSIGVFLFALISGAYLIANGFASLMTASRKGWRFLPLLPVIFSVLHVSYGLGFLFGLLRFAGRWGDKNGVVPTLSSLDA